MWCSHFHLLAIVYIYQQAIYEVSYVWYSTSTTVSVAPPTTYTTYLASTENKNCEKVFCEGILILAPMAFILITITQAFFPHWHDMLFVSIVDGGEYWWQWNMSSLSDSSIAHDDASLWLGQALLGLCAFSLFYINHHTPCIVTLTLTYSILPRIYQGHCSLPRISLSPCHTIESTLLWNLQTTGVRLDTWTPKGRPLGGLSAWNWYHSAERNKWSIHGGSIGGPLDILHDYLPSMYQSINDMLKYHIVNFVEWICIGEIGRSGGIHRSATKYFPVCDMLLYPIV